MGLVDEIYGASAAEQAPPEAERWSFFVSQGIKPVCTFVRRRDRDTWGPPRLVIAYPDAKPPLPPDPMIQWDPWLEDWLLAHHVAASTAANEVERIGFDLCTRFAALEKRCGTAELTAVLLRYLYDHGCALYIPLEKKLGAIRTYEPDSGARHVRHVRGHRRHHRRRRNSHRGPRLSGRGRERDPPRRARVLLA